MRFKKIYIEITNSCNLNCDFCIKNKRKINFMSKQNFSFILDKIKPYTNYVYLHVLGEPLLHPKINDFIETANSKGFFINLTTNGYLIKKISNPDQIRQINISMHSYNEKYNKSLDEYLNNIYKLIDNDNKTKISLRLWVKSKYTDEILDGINIKYNKKITKYDLIKGNNIKIKDNVYLNSNSEFIWPDLNNNCYEENGKCYGLIDHIGILSDGTIVPCCLDSFGIINLGNIYENDLCEILEQERVKKMIDGFKNNKKCEELCKHCKFL